MNEKPITIGGIEFSSRNAAIKHCRLILYRDEVGTAITGDDAKFVGALLQARPDKLDDIGDRTVVGYWRDVQPGRFDRTICFWAELDEGERLDFSFHKAIDNIVRAQHPPNQSAA